MTGTSEHKIIEKNNSKLIIEFIYARYLLILILNDYYIYIMFLFLRIT